MKSLIYNMWLYKLVFTFWALNHLTSLHCNVNWRTGILKMVLLQEKLMDSSLKANIPPSPPLHTATCSFAIHHVNQNDHLSCKGWFVMFSKYIRQVFALSCPYNNTFSHISSFVFLYLFDASLLMSCLFG